MYRSVSILLVLASAIVLLAGLAGGQAQAPRQMFMEVSMIVTGKDNAPVQDFKQEDIEIKDNNKKQEITLFEKVAGGAATPGKPALHNLVLLDCLNTTFSDLPENRTEMLKIINEFTKADNVTFLLLRQQLQVVSDPASSEGLLPRFAKQAFDPANPKLDAFNWVFSDQLGMRELFTPAGVIERVRIQNALGALQTIANNYQGRSGRKNLFWITRGVPLTVGESAAGYNESRLMLDDKSGKVQSAKTAADDLSVFAKDMDLTNRMLNNSAVAVYTIDAKNMAVDNMKTSDQASMTDVSKATGGIAYLSRRDIAGAVREAINDSKVSYVLRYNISDLKNDGKFHRIKIDTKRKDVKIRAREGYYAPMSK
jgi:VWFA-related protein